MKEKMRNGFFIRRLLCLTVLFAAVLLGAAGVRADDLEAHNYQEMTALLKKGATNWTLNPDDNFGWPTEPTEITLEGQEGDRISLHSTWVIPANVTVNQKCTVGGLFGNVSVCGTWNSEKYVSSMSVEAGGILHSKNSSINFLTVKSGGSLALDSGLLVGDGRTITIEKGASVTGSGSLVLCGAALQADGVQIPSLVVSTFTAHQEQAAIKGNITVQKLFVGGKETLTIPSGSSLTLIGTGYGGGRIVVESGASLYVKSSSFSLNTEVKSGGTLVQEKATPSAAAPKKGTVFTVGALKYKVTKAGEYVFVCGTKSKNVKSLTIPATVKYGEITYKVTGIAKNAFKNCKKLKTITVQSLTLKSVGAGALKNTAKKLTILVPPAKKDAYKTLFQGKGNAGITVK